MIAPQKSFWLSIKIIDLKEDKINQIVLAENTII
jgi:hypothetical protein